MGSHVFKWPYPANDVHVTGTFDDWGKSVQMYKVDDEWVKEMNFEESDFMVVDGKPTKMLYKFVVDNIWKVDANLETEGDGHYNTNNVLRLDQLKPRTTEDLPGAFPETPAAEPATFGVNPIPATAGDKNPITVAPGAPVPDPKTITSNTVQSTITTSQEDYEKAGSAPLPTDTTKEAQEYSINPLPATSGTENPVSVPAGEPLPPQRDITSNTLDSAVTTSKEDYEKAGSSAAVPEPTFSVNPIGSDVTTSKEAYDNAGSAATGTDPTFSVNPIGSDITTSKEAYDNAGASTTEPEPTFSVNPIGSDVTTSKEAYDQVGGDSAAEPTLSVNPIPATSGIGNPVSLPAGAPVPDSKEITSNTTESTVTTSKEDYERAGGTGISPYTAAAAGAVGGAIGGTALASAFTRAEGQKNVIPESGLPMNAPPTDTHTSPFISSVGSGATTAELASKVPLEPDHTTSSSGTVPTTADLASKVPLEPNPIISSVGTGSTTADLASKVPLESNPIISSVGTGSTTADLASKVPLETNPTISSVGPTTAELASKVPVEEDMFKSAGGPDTATSQLASDLEVPLKGTPFIQSSGPGTTTAALAAAVPLESTSGTAVVDPTGSSDVPAVVKESIAAAHEDPEAAASPEVVKEKAGLEKELLEKTKVAESAGKPATSAADQTSYYGLATAVPKTVEESMQQAHASPEAAVETSVVAEKTLLEEELVGKVPRTDAAGEPAPTITAATSTAAPTTSSATALATSVTDGKTANEPVPDTDTSTATRGPSAGEIAGGAAVGTAAATGAAALTERHHDPDTEPPRIPDAQKPDVTSEASPAAVTQDRVPGQSTSAAAAVSDGADLADEPAVQMMKQNEEVPGSSQAIESSAPAPTTTTTAPTAPVTAATEGTALGSAKAVDSSTAAPTTTAATETSTPGTKDPSSVLAAAGVPSLTSAGTVDTKAATSAPGATTSSPEVKVPSTPVKHSAQDAGASSPATSTAASNATHDKKKKKRHRISAFFHKVFD